VPACGHPEARVPIPETVVLHMQACPVEPLIKASPGPVLVRRGNHGAWRSLADPTHRPAHSEQGETG